jgi:succinate-semialdehyde dehydrogenase/glutarate-semialdehyde dehydrogenase
VNYPDVKMLIGGQWRDSAQRQDVLNPATETPVGSVPLASAQDLQDALQAAKEGLRVWRGTSPVARGQVLTRAAELLRSRVDAIAHALVLEQGKVLAGARGEVTRGCTLLDWDAAEGRRLYGRIIPGDPHIRNSAVREPIGVVAAFSPWNAPFASPMRKIAGALAAGCSLVLKPAEETPASAWFIAQALQDAGLPAGVFNLVYGNPEEVSSTLIADPAVRMVTFTGSVPVGRKLSALAGQYLKPAIMELGGHAPVLICRDADPVAVAAKALVAKSVNSGQICVSPTRFFVEEPVFESFVQALAEGARAVRVGNGLDAASQIGPLTNGRRVAAIHELVEDARNRGARVLAGGQKPAGPGYFYPLTVLANVPDDARVMHEEPFGPLAVVNPIASLDEGIARANELPLGLAAYAFTESVKNLDAISTRVEVGSLAINHFSVSSAETPFGGIKDSGFGREGGIEGVEAYTVIKSISQWVG